MHRRLALTQVALCICPMHVFLSFTPTMTNRPADTRAPEQSMEKDLAFNLVFCGGRILCTYPTNHRGQRLVKEKNPAFSCV